MTSPARDERRWAVTTHRDGCTAALVANSCNCPAEVWMPVSEHEALIGSVKLDRDSWKTHNQKNNEYLLAKVTRLEANLAALRDTAQAVVDIYDVYPTRGWRELAALKGQLPTVVR